MSDFHKEMVEELVRGWTTIQITEYILKLEERIKDTQNMIRTLKTLRRKKNRKLYDTGVRDGR
jgi:hypothetical protein